MKIAILTGGALALILAQTASAQDPAAAPTLMIDRPELKSNKALSITSADFAAGDPIPLDDSAYGASKSPPLVIAGAPSETKSFAILMEDADSQYAGAPILHWFAYNLPGDVARVPAALPEGDKLTAPVILDQGLNIRGKAAYFGPHPPAKPPFTHHYHIEVFALDITLPDSLADRGALASAMTGHVLAEGELLGTYTAPKPAGTP